MPLPGSNSRSFASDAGAGRHGRPLGLVSQGNRMFGGIEKWTGVLTIQVVHPTPAPSDQGSIPLVGDQFCPSNCPTIEAHLVSPERRPGRVLPPELGERYACGPSRQGRPLSQGGDTGSNPVGVAKERPVQSVNMHSELGRPEPNCPPERFRRI